MAAPARSLEEIIKAGEVRVGVNPTLPPLALLNEKNELDGFDVEVANLIAKKLGVRLKAGARRLARPIPFVIADKIDFVMGTIYRRRQS